MFHSLEGSGKKRSNGVACGPHRVLRRPKATACLAYAAYGVVTPERKRELGRIRKLAEELGVGRSYTLGSIRQVHERRGWDWAAANAELETRLRRLKKDGYRPATRDASTQTDDARDEPLENEIAAFLGGLCDGLVGLERAAPESRE